MCLYCYEICCIAILYVTFMLTCYYYILLLITYLLYTLCYLSTVGPGDTLDWLSDMTFSGSIENDRISGEFTYESLIKCPPPLTEGEAVIDENTIHSAIVYNSKTDILCLKDETKKGRYFASVKLRPFSSAKSIATTTAGMTPTATTSTGVEFPSTPLSLARTISSTVNSPTSDTIMNSNDSFTNNNLNLSEATTPTKNLNHLSEEVDTEIEYSSIGQNQGSIWMEWEVVASRHSILIGVYEESQLLSINSEINSHTAVASASGSHAPQKSLTPPPDGSKSLATLFAGRNCEYSVEI